uniref:Uncharacterized protein n=1 Tax=Setaria viridis TaxID=4556 RepID=A0A4V6Y8W0_SETVI|nr:hypothetical protein SEVIR_2G263866v2 [Setaria viridis]
MCWFFLVVVCFSSSHGISSCLGLEQISRMVRLYMIILSLKSSDGAISPTTPCLHHFKMLLF